MEIIDSMLAGIKLLKKHSGGGQPLNLGAQYHLITIRCAVQPEQLAEEEIQELTKVHWLWNSYYKDWRFDLNN